MSLSKDEVVESNLRLSRRTTSLRSTTAPAAHTRPAKNLLEPAGSSHIQVRHLQGVALDELAAEETMSPIGRTNWFGAAQTAMVVRDECRRKASRQAG